MNDDAGLQKIVSEMAGQIGKKLDEVESLRAENAKLLEALRGLMLGSSNVLMNSSDKVTSPNYACIMCWRFVHDVVGKALPEAQR